MKKSKCNNTAVKKLSLMQGKKGKVKAGHLILDTHVHLYSYKAADFFKNHMTSIFFNIFEFKGQENFLKNHVNSDKRIYLK